MVATPGTSSLPRASKRKKKEKEEAESEGATATADATRAEIDSSGGVAPAAKDSAAGSPGKEM